MFDSRGIVGQTDSSLLSHLKEGVSGIMRIANPGLGLWFPKE